MNCTRRVRNVLQVRTQDPYLKTGGDKKSRRSAGEVAAKREETDNERRQGCNEVGAFLQPAFEREAVE